MGRHQINKQKEVIPRPGRKVSAMKRRCARTQLMEVWEKGKADQLPPKVRLAVETLVPELGRVKHDQTKM